MRRAPTIVVMAAAILGLSACYPSDASTGARDADPGDAGESHVSTPPTAHGDAAYLDAVESYPRELPAGYAFPAGLTGADTAEKWWWCATVDAAFTAHFRLEDDAAALDHLRAAEEVDPGSFGDFERTVGNARIDREVRYIADGVDAQYLEYTANGCWRWGRSLGHEFPTVLGE